MKINLVKFGQCDAGCCQWWHNLRCPPWRQCWLLPQILDMKLKCLKPHSNRPWVLCSPICFLWYVVDATWLQHIVFKILELELAFRFGGTQKCNLWTGRVPIVDNLQQAGITSHYSSWNPMSTMTTFMFSHKIVCATPSSDCISLHAIVSTLHIC